MNDHECSKRRILSGNFRTCADTEVRISIKTVSWPITIIIDRIGCLVSIDLDRETTYLHNSLEAAPEFETSITLGSVEA